LQWLVPRELLWAIVFGLAIAVAALWPSHYPYNKAPEINSQHQAKDGVGGSDPPHVSPAPQVNAGSDQQNQRSGEHTPEVTILGIKPGEWLLSIVTLMLWGATVGLVRGSDRTAERQLRAYVHLKNLEVRQIMDPWGVSGIHRETPILFVTWENAGQTPTRNMTTNSNWASFETDIPGDFQFPDDPLRAIGLLGPRQTQELKPRQPLPIDILSQAAERKIKIYVWGWVEYDDVFAGTPRHRTEFAAELTVHGLPGVVCHYTLQVYPKHNGADDDCMKPAQTPRK
jgi:hypothetical protein